MKPKRIDLLAESKKKFVVNNQKKEMRSFFARSKSIEPSEILLKRAQIQKKHFDGLSRNLEKLK